MAVRLLIHCRNSTRREGTRNLRYDGSVTGLVPIEPPRFIVLACVLHVN